jgi:hypothetical protein
VSQAAQTRTAQVWHPQPAHAVTDFTTLLERTRPVREMPPGLQPHPHDDRPADRSVPEWGGLPAPWEPLPAWIISPPPSVAAVVKSDTPLMAGSPPPAADAAPAVQRAARDRSVDEESATPGSSAERSPEQGLSPEPDLDMLARQVYAILRRRLAAERRREG